MPSALIIRISCCLILVSFLNGCAALNSVALIPSRIGEKWAFRSRIAQEKQLDKAAVHKAKLEDFEDERVTLSISRDLLVEKRRLARETLKAQEEAERDLLIAQANLEQEAVQPRYKEKLKTDLGLEFDQRMRLGQLQVNLPLLEEKMKSWKVEQAAAQKQFNLKNKEWRDKRVRDLLDSGDTKGAAELLQADCTRPLTEKNLEERNLEEPPQMAILPTEIPLMLPVTLDLEIQRPTFRQTRVSRVPIPVKQCEERNLEDGCVDSCDKCAPTGKGKKISLAPPAIYRSALNDSLFESIDSEAVPPAPDFE